MTMTETILGSRADLVRLLRVLRENRATLALFVARGDDSLRDELRQAGERVGTAEGWLQVMDFAALNGGPLRDAIEAGVEGVELDAIASQVAAQSLAAAVSRQSSVPGTPSGHRARRRRYCGGRRS